VYGAGFVVVGGMYWLRFCYFMFLSLVLIFMLVVFSSSAWMRAVVLFSLTPYMSNEICLPILCSYMATTSLHSSSGILMMFLTSSFLANVMDVREGIIRPLKS
jgi:hypothetical protein